jgi:tetratricopeptide (TPR) repeat protein
MRVRSTKAVLLILLVSGLFLVVSARAQTETDAKYKAERAEAVKLFGENKYLDALPLFESLAAENPKDDVVLLGLGACLLAHSKTLADAEAQGKERSRSLESLKKAHDLGNNSPLLLNLLDLMQGTPQVGKTKYSEIPAADDAMQAGEGAFARQDYDAAIKNYSHALELDANNNGAALFVGDSYFAKKDFANAGEWYARASQVDPNVETPYRYYADMLTKNGDMSGARSKAIQAVVAEPYNPITWRALEQWAKANHLQLTPVHVNVPKSPEVSQAGPKTNITITVPSGSTTDSGAAWLAYSMSQALWHGDKFKQQYPQETEYRHPLAEEADSLRSAAKVWSELTAKKKSATPDADLALLLKIDQADMIEPYVLLNAADQGIARDYPEFREKNRSKLAQYLSQFVVPSVPPKP